jgi:RNA recognition motif-containing protein
MYRKADQVIQPYWFGDAARKSTCLWLKNLPLLEPTDIVEPDVYYYVAKNGKIKSDSKWRSQCSKEERAKVRSKTFPGFAKAMADQWG